MKKLLEEIRSCRERKDIYAKCNRFGNHIPLYMQPASTASIMIISESPSCTASERKALNTFKNPTFKNDVLPLIFNKHITQIEQEELVRAFNERFYWTHYCKCYPGEDKSSLNGVCARTYLRKEIALFKPELIITVGAPASKFLFNIGRRKSMSPLVNKINTYVYDGVEIPTICLTHFSRANNPKNKNRLKFEETIALIRKTLFKLDIRYSQ